MNPDMPNAQCTGFTRFELSRALQIFIIVLTIYFFAKLIFLIYNAGEVVQYNVVFTEQECFDTWLNAGN